MSVSLTVRPKLLRWARERASLSPDQLAVTIKVPLEQVAKWERSGTIMLARLKKLAQKTHTPLGYFFLQEPPDDSLPIKLEDLLRQRTVKGEHVEHKAKYPFDITC